MTKLFINKTLEAVFVAFPSRRPASWLTGGAAAGFTAMNEPVRSRGRALSQNQKISPQIPTPWNSSAAPRVQFAKPPD